MVDADHLRIIFQVNGVGFVMPVADLLAIRDLGEAMLTPLAQPLDSFQLGTLLYRETAVTVYDLAQLFGLIADGHCENGPLLIFSGSDYPWAVRVDQVSGVLDEEHFEFQELPAHLFYDAFVPYSQVALHDGRLLVSVDSRQIDEAWRRSG
jgi:chemotaxis signal transduction protein